MLIHPSIESEPGTVLIFDPDNMKKTTISLRGSNRPLYDVDTDKSLTHTYIRRSSDNVPLASLERREIIPDKITLGGAPAVNVNKWLKSSRFTSLL